MIRSSVFASCVLVLSALPASADVPYLRPGVPIEADGSTLTVTGHAAPEVVDWNNDGKKDLIVGEVVDGPQGRVRLYLNTRTDSNPAFGAFSYIQAGGSDLRVDSLWDQGACPRVVDWNEDGRKDLVVGDAYGKISLFLNTGTDSNPSFSGSSYLRVGGSDFDCGYRATPEIVDWNNDGRKDLLSGDFEGRINLLINVGTNASPVFSESVYLRDNHDTLDVGGPGNNDRSHPVIVDWNGDGKKDLLSGRWRGYVTCYENQGTDGAPAFNPTKTIQAGGTFLYVGWYSRIDVCDWNNDGELDLLVGNEDGNVYLFLATPSGADCWFQGTQSYTVRPLYYPEPWQACWHNYTTGETIVRGPFYTALGLYVEHVDGEWRGLFLYSHSTGRWEEALWAYRANW